MGFADATLPGHPEHRGQGIHRHCHAGWNREVGHRGVLAASGRLVCLSGPIGLSVQKRMTDGYLGRSSAPSIRAIPVVRCPRSITGLAPIRVSTSRPLYLGQGRSG